MSIYGLADDFTDKVPLLLSFTQTKSTDALAHGLSNGTAIDSTTDKVAHIVSKQTTKQGADALSNDKIPIWIPFKGANAVAFGFLVYFFLLSSVPATILEHLEDLNSNLLLSYSFLIYTPFNVAAKYLSTLAVSWDFMASEIAMQRMWETEKGDTPEEQEKKVQEELLSSETSSSGSSAYSDE